LIGFIYGNYSYVTDLLIKLFWFVVFAKLSLKKLHAIAENYASPSSLKIFTVISP
jgi:hypothetical protein